jgi:dipeptidyl aminopeptidase/acylaminoacyl peptidase
MTSIAAALMGILLSTLALARGQPAVEPSLAAPPPHSATVLESVRLRTFEPGLLQLSPDGKQVAYVLREPNVERNVNDMVLYVLPLPTGERASAVQRGRGREVFRTTGDIFNRPAFQWLADSKGLLVLHKPSGAPGRLVSRVNVATKASTVVYQGELDVEAFAANARGDRLVLSGAVPTTGKPGRFDSKRGVVITPDDHLRGLSSQIIQKSFVHEVRVVEPGGVTATLYRSPAAAYPERVFLLSISPNGRHVVFSAPGTAGVPVPAAWKKDHLYNWLRPVLLLQLPARLADARSVSDPAGSLMQWPYRILYDAPYVTRVEWSDDGGTLLVQAPLPVGDGVAVSADPAARERELGASRQRLYAIDVASGSTAVVQQSAAKRDSVRVLDALVESIIAFDQNGSRVVLKQSNGDIVTLRRPAGADRTAAWIEERRSKTDVAGYRKGEATTVGNDQVVVGVNQGLMVPPDLYVMQVATGKKTILTEINPELKDQQLGRVEKLEWLGSDGTKYSGYIVYPVNYVPGTRYPCAILNKSWDDSFVHGGQVYSSNFPPQALAGSDILVFMLAGAYGDTDWNKPQLSDAYRAFAGARQQLAERGLIDPTRVGVMGFSFTSFSVDFLLTHPGPDPQFAAAVSADGGLGGYVAHVTGPPKETLSADMWYGSRPYGESLATWLKLSPGFNAQHVRTPLLQQWHGSGVGSAAEFHNALYAQGKPVELIWFPGGIHILQLPSEREGSMQQVVDWFRFWLQDYERPSVPEDPDRYVRWRKLREQHQENERLLAAGKDPAVEFAKALAAEQR